MSGTVISKGRFRVDRKRALDKIERFQLEDPRRYVLELLAAAVCGGASRVDFTNDSDDFVVQFDAPRLTGEELDGLLDHLFGKPPTDRAAMRQHLAVAVLGALGLSPRWVHVDSGDDELSLRVTVDDPVDTQHVPLSPPVSGVRVHVRERTDLHRIGEAMRLMFAEPEETQLIRGAAIWYPLPLTVNGAPVETAPEPEGWLLRWSGRHRGRRGRLWLLPGDEPGRIDLVRNGIVVGHHVVDLGRHRIVGCVDVSDLRLNASRSALVADKTHAKALEEIDALVGRLLVKGLADLDPVQTEEVLTWRSGGRPRRASRLELLCELAKVVVPRLAAKGWKLGSWGGRKLLVDIRERRWSVAELRERADAPCWTDTVVDVPNWTRPTFASSWEPALRVVDPESEDASALLTVAAEGQRRRLLASERRAPAAFEDPTSHRFRDGSLEGAVLRAGGLGPKLQLRLQIRGVFVETVTLPWELGGMRGVLDHADFATDLGFLHVLKDRVYDEALERFREEASAYTFARLEAPPADGDAWSERTAWVTELLRGRGDLTADALADLGRVGDVPALRRGDGAWMSVHQFVAGDTVWIPMEIDRGGLDLADLTDVVYLTGWMRRVWRGWLPDRLRASSDLLDQRRRRRAVLSRGKVEPVHRGHAVFKQAVDGPGRRGELAVVQLTGVVLSRVRILARGLPVTQLTLEGSANVRGVLDVDIAQPDVAHENLDNEAQVRRVVREEVDRLTVAWWQSLPEGPPPVAILPWLAGQSAGTVTDVMDRAVVYTLAGDPVTVEDLVRLGAKRKGRKLVLLRERPGVPGFDDAVLDEEHLTAALDAIANGRYRYGDRDVDKIREQLSAYLRRAPHTSPKQFLAHTMRVGEGWQARAYLLSDPKRIGKLELSFLHEGRVLTHRMAAGTPGVVLEIRGEAVVPNRAYTGLAEERLVSTLRRVASEALPELAGIALDRGGALGHEPAWRALLRQLHQSKGDGALLALRGRLAGLRLLPEASGRMIRVADIDDDAEIHLVAAVTVPGALPEEGVWLRDEPHVADLVQAVFGRRPKRGDDRLVGWRAARRRASTEVRRQAVVVQPTLGKRAFAGRGASGEVAVVHGTPGLAVVPVVDGLELQTVRLAQFPVPVRAVVAGEAVRADLRFESVQEGTVWTAVLGELRSAARAVAREVAEARPELPWVADFVVSDQASADLAVFPLADGTFVSLRQLRARAERDGGVAVVTPVHAARYASLLPEPPVLARSEALVAALSRRVKVVDLEEAALRAPAPGWSILDAPFAAEGSEGVVGIGVLGRDGIWLARDGVYWAKLSRERGDYASAVPLRGVLTVSELTPGPLLGPPAPIGGSALAGALAAHGDALVRNLVALSAVRALRDRERRVLASTLRTLLPDGPGDLTGPRVQPLAELPLYPSADGSWFSLRELRDLDGILHLSESAEVPRPPGMPPLLWLHPADVAWMRSAGWSLSDGTDRLAQRRRGHARRRALPEGRPQPPLFAAREERRWSEGSITTWLLAPERETDVQVFVDDRPVCALPVAVPGLAGWVAGPFRTNEAFDEVALPDVARTWLEQDVATLLSDEAQAAPARFRRRILAALKGLGLARLLKLEPAWAGVRAMEVVVGGEVVRRSFGELAYDGPRGRVLLVGRGEFDAVEGREVFVGAHVPLLEALFPHAKVQTVAEFRSVAADKASRKARRESERTRDKATKTLVRQARALGPDKHGATYKEAAAELLASGDFVGADAACLAAWWVALRVGQTHDAGERPAKLARAAAARFRGPR
jgi:hypothetical protein